MNNNKPNKPRFSAPDTAEKGDSSINTKKGFLISFPHKKKGESDNASSGIVFAKPSNQNDGSKSEHKAPVHPQKSERAFGNAENAHDKNHGDKNEARLGNAPRHTRNSKNGNRPKNASGQNGNKGEKPAQNVPKAQTEPVKEPVSGQQNQDARPNNAPKGRNDRRGGKPHGAKPQNKNDRPNTNAGGKSKAHDSRDNQNSPNSQSRRDRGRGKDNRQKPRSMPQLSPLSADMASFEKALKADAFKKVDKIAGLDEKSLEDKYKDAVPLAEQIAAEEERRHRKPRATQIEKIDRTKIAHADRLTETPDGQADESAEAVDGQADTPSFFEVVGVRFREAGKVYYFDPDGKDVPFGTPVIVETARGSEYGYTAIANRLVPATSIVPPLKKLKRIASAQDTEKYLANKELEASAAEVFKKKVAELDLAMHLVFVEYTFDNSKLLFYFTAETRIDFRELVKELASVFRTRIELRQIGVRDEAKIIGGIGVCGRCLCCNSFLGDFAQVSIKMAKDQNLSLNSAKISGACGKLMCCLRYEDKVYEQEMARTPKVGAVVETPEGKGVVTEANALKGLVKVSIENNPEAPPKPFSREEVTVIGFNKAAAKKAEPVDMKELKELQALEDDHR